jgi:hypothetical protein
MTIEAKNFDQAIRRILSVSRGELKRREEDWKREKEARKQATISPVSRVSRAKD